MKEIALISIALLVLFAGCVQQPELPAELPEDFEVEYGSGAMHLDWGYYTLKIDSGGSAVFEKLRGVDSSKRYSFSVSEPERKKIYDSAMVNGFFSLNDNYEDLFVMDGGWSKITIRANGKSKTVNLQNYYLDSFEKVETEISTLILSKVGEEAFSFTDLAD